MTQQSIHWLCVPFAVALVAGGCGDDDGGVVSDPGGHEDAGVWMPFDVGFPPRPDASLPEEDGGGLDAGVRECIPITHLPAEALPRCTATTRDCIDACPEPNLGDACLVDCWASDTTEPLVGSGNPVGCANCINNQLIACMDAGGCHPEVANFLCCIADNCAGGGADGCVAEHCGEETTAMYTCSYYESRECFAPTRGDLGMCYASEDPPPPTDGGMRDTDASMDPPDAGAGS